MSGLLNPYIFAVEDEGEDPGGGGPAAGAHRYWRIRITGVQSGDQVQCRQCRFMDRLDDTDYMTGGTASASSVDGAAVASRAFDGSETTGGSNFWLSDSSDLADGEAWLAYDFGVGNEREVFAVYVNSTASVGAAVHITDFDLQYSDNGVDWTTQFSVSTFAWGGGQTFYDPAEQLLSNGGFDLGNFTGWTAAAGFNVLTSSSGGDDPRRGTHLCNKSSGGTADVYQEIDVSAIASDIDAGNVTAVGFLAGINWSTDSDRAGIYVEFRDNVSAVISTLSETTTEQEWTEMLVSGVMPSGTRTVRFIARAELSSGGTANVAMDECFFGYHNDA